MKKQKKLEIIYKKVDDLIPYENNPRNNDDAVPYVAKSIREFGFRVPIIIDEDDVIVTGHTRLKAAKELGMKEVPCCYADDLTQEQIKAFRLADNKVSEIATWNDEKLEMELDEIVDIDMGDFGFDISLDDIEEELKKIKEPSKSKEPKTAICPECGHEFEI